MKKLIKVLIILALLSVIFTCVFRQPKEVIIYENTTDTLLIRDTIRIPPPEPQRIYVTRYDTIFVVYNDTLHIPIPIPIERKEYKTDQYFAVVQGYKPELITNEIFTETKIITNTEIQKIKIKPRFGLGVGVGYGFNGSVFTPYIGVSLNYNIITF